MKKLLVLSLTLLTAVGGASAWSMPLKDQATQLLKAGYERTPSKEALWKGTEKTWGATKSGIKTAWTKSQPVCKAAWTKSQPARKALLAKAKAHPRIVIAGVSLSTLYVAYKAKLVKSPF
ncbi:MAG TPA: hypothetical protein QGF02_04135 [Candidatus Babeliales bacterium]|nr:hypothetical protein [Candidatus Babeliales bacterium]